MRQRHSKQIPITVYRLFLGFLCPRAGELKRKIAEMQHCGLEVGNTDHTKIAKAKVRFYYFRSFSNMSIEYHHYMRLSQEVPVEEAS